MALLTFSVYVGSAIYTAGIAGPNSIMSEFDVSMTTALVGLTVFVLGYGFSPMLWAPLSEFPSIGRLPVCESSLIDSGNLADDQIWVHCLSLLHYNFRLSTQT
jgi:DHA1 family multidrug resistance protein-like MFS transporter